MRATHLLVGQSGTALDEILGSAQKVTRVVGEIAAASREQSLGVDQVNPAVSQMDRAARSQRKHGADSSLAS